MLCAPWDSLVRQLWGLRAVGDFRGVWLVSTLDMCYPWYGMVEVLMVGRKSDLGWTLRNVSESDMWVNLSTYLA